MSLVRRFLNDFRDAFAPSHERVNRRSSAEFDIVFAVVLAAAFAIWTVGTGMR
jgi:hypothetical protein